MGFSGYGEEKQLEAYTRCGIGGHYDQMRESEA